MPATLRGSNPIALCTARALSAAALLAALLLVPMGCAKPAGELFPPLAAPLSWPNPPDEPRIHYVGQIATTADLKAAKPFGEALRELFAGKQPILGIVSPMAVEFDDQQRLYVADTAARVVHVFDLDKRKYEQWMPPAPDTFITPVGLARAGDGRLFVADSSTGVVWLFDSTGRSIGMWGLGHLIRPCGLSFDEAGQRLFVADAGAHRIAIFGPGGELLSTLGSRGTAPGSFNFPTDVVIDHQGRLYVSDSLNCRIQQFGSDLMPRRQIGSRGDLPGYFSRPKGIAVDSADHLYVVDAQFEAVQVYSSEGQLLMAFGREGRGPGEFWLPAGMCIDDSDRLWIADTYNRRVQVFDYRPPAPTSDTGPNPGPSPAPKGVTP
ncbi:MAG: hypothetical protein IT430_07585 [Phycisphaerales bacterium]|nr:hypothetical protein [Phycisphaerales bacterium]